MPDVKEGTKSIEVDELAQAHRTIAELEAELAVAKAAVRPVQRGGASQPKRRCQVAKGLSNLGYRERVACRVAGVSSARASTSTSTTCQVTARSAGSCSAAWSPTSTSARGAPMGCCGSERPSSVSRT